MTRPDPETPYPLAGFTVAVTAARRAEELGAMLQRKGAAVVHAPAIRIVPLPDDTELLAVTKSIVDTAPDVVVATTGIGFRGWIEAAEGWGLSESLVSNLRKTTLLARGPKAKGAIRAAGLVEAWSPASESSAEVLDYLLESGVDGQRIAVQLHGEPLPDFVEALRCAGATVVDIPVYRWMPPADVGPLERLVDTIVNRGVDAVTFTSAPAVLSLLTHARGAGLEEEMLAALRRDVLAACVGPVTAGPLEARDVATSQPQRARLGAMVRLLAVDLPARARQLPVAGHWLGIRAAGVVLNGELRVLPPAGMALLRILARRPGHVVSRSELLGVLPGDGNDEHAVETAVARLRAALGVPRLIQTVVKRGYRLAYEPDAEPAYAAPDYRSKYS